MYERICALCVFLLLTPASALADLTGKWDADDGGAYYLRQIGNQLHWYGERFPTHTRWSNVFHGDINGNRIDGRWVDVPKGRAGHSAQGALQRGCRPAARASSMVASAAGIFSASCRIRLEPEG